MDNTGREYRYQKDWSVGDRMFHVRCDDWEEFKTACQNVATMIPETQNKATANHPATSQTTLDYPRDCKKCGAKMVNNPNTGKWFCQDKCWLKK